MSSSQLRDRIAAIRAEAAAVGAELAADGGSMEPGELFEVTGELQGVANAVEGAQLVAIAHAGSHETRLTDRGPVQVHHEVGFIDAMTSTEVSLATGVGQWAAGRKVGLAANLAGRFTKLLAKVMTGELATVNASKVITACDGLDDTACAAVEDVMVDRVVGMDPARVTTVTRKVATRIAADQVAAATAKNRTDRLVQVTPGPDGTTDWWARLPAARSAAAWAAVRDLADRYTKHDPELSVDQARADALLDLLLTNVTITATVTLGIPVITGPDGQTARDTAIADHHAETRARSDDTSTADATGSDPADATGVDRAGTTQANSATSANGSTGAVTSQAPATGAGATCPVATDVNDPNWVRPAIATGGLGLGSRFSLSAALLSGCEIPGIGFIDADTVEALLTVVPTDIGRALLDARTGTLIESVSHAYRPSKSVTDFVTTRDGTCRMWGCTRPATTCDVDHARPWPAGATTPTNLAGLCRRHHRLKQRRRWTYQLAPDGTATWTSPTGKKRITQPDFAAIPPPPTPPTKHSPALVDTLPPPF
ncbi:MAG TPA: HNH endonuclease signature motif containing protein [Ornithinibacter sp.]|nr:HNH endonuclease signature motif containing protein [Ornithinibacter sp.]